MYNKLAIVASFIMYISFSIALRSPLTRLPTATLHQNGCAASLTVITSAPEIIQDISSNDTTEESISDASSAVGESVDTKGNTYST
jgi:hypothetical protein